MPVKTYRVAILGCRGRGTAAARAYYQHPRTELVALCDRVPQLLEELGEEVEVAARFSKEELVQLWERFAPLDALLQAKEDQFTPGFQSQPMKYNFEVMPEGFGVDEFVKSWNS